MNVTDKMPNIIVERLPIANDSLKFAGIEKTFNIVDIVPSSDVSNDEVDPQYSAQINDILSTLKALQVAKKSLSDVQSIAKDIKSNYRVEKNDAWSPIDDTMLRQRYEATVQIKDILTNAIYNHKNVFTMDYSDKGIKLDINRKSLDQLNLRDEHSINIFSYNIDMLSNQIEHEIQKLQAKIDKIEESRWLSMEKLRNVRLEQKSVNNELKNTNMIPSLASALAQVANNQTQNSSDSDVAALLNNDKSASDNAPANLSSSPNIATTTSNNPEIQENSNTNGNVVVGIAKNNAPQDIDESLNTTQMPQNTESPNIQSLDDSSPSSKQNTDIDTQTNNTQTNTSSQMNTIQSQTRDSTTTNATTENTSSQDNTESTAQNNANNGNTVGIVSGDDKERVVDLFL